MEGQKQISGASNLVGEEYFVLYVFYYINNRVTDHKESQSIQYSYLIVILCNFIVLREKR